MNDYQKICLEGFVFLSKRFVRLKISHSFLTQYLSFFFNLVGILQFTECVLLPSHVLFIIIVHISDGDSHDFIPVLVLPLKLLHIVPHIY